LVERLRCGRLPAQPSGQWPQILFAGSAQIVSFEHDSGPRRLLSASRSELLPDARNRTTTQSPRLEHASSFPRVACASFQGRGGIRIRHRLKPPLWDAARALCSKPRPEIRRRLITTRLRPCTHAPAHMLQPLVARAASATRNGQPQRCWNDRRSGCCFGPRGSRSGSPRLGSPAATIRKSGSGSQVLRVGSRAGSSALGRLRIVGRMQGSRRDRLLSVAFAANSARPRGCAWSRQRTRIARAGRRVRAITLPALTVHLRRASSPLHAPCAAPRRR
jgi:hypothetical protein